MTFDLEQQIGIANQIALTALQMGVAIGRREAAPIPVAPASPDPSEPLPSAAGAGGAGTHFKPTPEQIVSAVATAFDVNEQIAYGWIVEAFSNQRRVA